MLRWMKTHHHHSKVSLVGESAGGNLVTMLAALLENRDSCLKKFNYLCRNTYFGNTNHSDNILHWKFPKITSVVSWYGILDRKSWVGKGFLSWGLQFTVDCHRDFNPLPSKLSISERKKLRECEFLTLVDCCEKGLVKRYPRCLLISGTTDPLGLLYSSRLARITLEKHVKELDLVYSEYNAGHAFIG